MSKVIIVRGKGVLRDEHNVNRKILLQMLLTGLNALTGQKSQRIDFNGLFHKQEKVGIKINTISGKWLSTQPAVSLSLADMLTESGLMANNIIIWDRTNRELKDSGYRLNLASSEVRIFGTDTSGIGYSSNLISHRNIGSLFSAIQSDLISSSISLAVLKDHGLAGVTASLKNYFGAIHNPNKYHDSNCNPFVAELFDTKQVKTKHKISVLDALTVQYHKGPAYHPKWAKKCEILVFSTDAVAADSVGWQIIEKLRKEKGLPSLAEEQREPSYLKTAENMELGQANKKNIQIVEADV